MVCHPSLHGSFFSVRATQSLLYSMSRWWKEKQRSEPWIEPLCWPSEGGREEASRADEDMLKKMTLTEPAQRIVLEERNPWVTLTESCESDETEDEGKGPFRAPPGLLEPPKIREPTLGWETALTANAEIGERRKQRRLEQADAPLDSQLECGNKKGEVTDSMIGSFHVITIQEAETGKAWVSNFIFTWRQTHSFSVVKAPSNREERGSRKKAAYQFKTLSA